MNTLQEHFNKWRAIVTFRKYDDWCALPETQKMFNEIHQEPKKVVYDATFI